MKNAYLLKEKVKNKEYEIKQAIWEVLGELNEVCKWTKYEVYIQIFLTWADHFSKYAWWFQLEILKQIPVRNKLVQIFINIYQSYL